MRLWRILASAFRRVSLSGSYNVLPEGRQSDRESSASFISRWTFSWAGPILYNANRMGSLEIEDLPQVPSEYSAIGLRSAFSVKQSDRLYTSKQQFISTVWHFAYKTLPSLALLTVACVALGFAPQAALFGLLRFIEEDNRGSGAWVYVLGLCLPLVVSAVLEHRRYWISYRSLSLRLQNHLMVALFDKAVTFDSFPGTGRSADSEDGRMGSKQSSGNLTNLMAVDVKRVSDFVSNSFSVYETPLRLLISSVVLIRLVGWQSLFVSILILLLFWPLNNYAIERYSCSQKALMEYRDRKLASVTEALHGIRQIKFSAKEEQWEEKINALRAGELEVQREAFQWNLVLMSFYLLTPTVLSTVLLTVYSLLHGSLSPATAFTAMSILNTVQNSLNAVPSVVTAGSNCIRSAKRLSEYMDTLQHLPAVLPSRSIDFCEASLTWRGSSGYNVEVLKNVNMCIPQNCLTLITGPTGAGKSLLLAAMLGECDILSGTVKAPTGREWTPISEKYHGWLLEDTIAYVAQTPWIEALTIRDNILFGLPFDARRYKQVIFACALESDLQAMVDGDETQLGPNGVNLSGGQKARLCLARALYSRATVLLLDDIFSSVDVHTAAHLCHYALAGPLARDRTRILVTHHVSLCRDHAQGIVHVNGGTAHFSPVANPETQDEVDDSWTDHLDMKPFVKGVGHSSSNNDATVRSSQKFIVEETREKGAVKWTVLQDYIQQSGTRSYWMCLVMAFLSYSVLMLSRTWLLGKWSQSYQSQASDEQYNVSYYAKIYITLSVLVCTVGATRSYFAMIGSLRASEVLFRRFLHQVLRTPLRWIDTVPLGRILNRFSNDFNLVDSQLGDDMRAILSYGMDVLMAVVPSLIINPLSLISSFILGLITARYANWYLVAARQIKRLDSVARSPIYDHLESCMAGLWTIRAFGKTRVYQEQFRQRLDRRARTQWHSWLFNQWLAVRLDMIGAVFTAICAAAVVLLEVEASIAGFAINFTLKLTQSISFGIRNYASLELDLNSVERVLEYCRMETESDDGNPAPAGWPYDGTLEVRNLSVQYAPDIEPALHNVTFRVEHNQRIGIVGRTGAGKSSLALSLFRVLEPCAGQILIDGLDISTIRLHDIRSRLAIIPQSPFLFKGTVRSNLDPSGGFEDSQLIHALSRVNWSSATSSENHQHIRTGRTLGQDPPILDHLVSDGGSNLSHGQRQLLCLARELLRMPRILVLDEATSAVDKETDGLVQHSIRSEFGRNGTTLLVVAHRLSTVADFDRILVLGGGTVLEFGSPAELMRRKNGAFRDMVETDAERELLYKKIFASRR
ncbi:P-loop containing nucleoside triphosphate hydrolase protein [Aspergillus costaricaensis CBS 115574]|uniref:P-loop containing nucleoside triphosphate hydrolase protein n=1 Tax=Aspergillus costaricaensis CBS 115574 TaxID=1448317 RepID=A0ACD1II27_9EURO|nr:P-loop containing nucleoside triphosphate hydrolase protein [Aspergillus costaricaensis CBS 115574]RAK89414.1 P-loop containing nucleoside triphosphate hydrolase protein [Aspergillus costaricaensis CBS 115574]